MDAIHVRTRPSGLVVKIYPDEFPDSPRDWDNTATLAFGKRQCPCDGDGLISEFAKKYGIEGVEWSGDVSPEGFTAFREWLTSRGWVFLPLYVYSHSGVAVSTSPFSCPWDSGLAGIAWVEPEVARKVLGEDYLDDDALVERFEAQINAEVEAYNQYLASDIYGYTVTRESAPDDVLDSCWGIYGFEECAAAGAGQAACIEADDEQARFKIGQEIASLEGGEVR